MKEFVKQLRSGNYLQDKPISIPKMSLYSDGVTAITAYGIHMLEQGFGDYTPIPVTGEVLLKCGFENCLSERGDYHFLFGKDTPIMSGLFVVIDLDDYSICIGQVDRFSHQFGKFEYLHQLQNFIFDISGKELIYASI